MDFFFPDSQDQVDPRFDFSSETHLPHRVRQRDDLYAHEVHDAPPYAGMLLSKTIVDGLAGAGRYSAPQRHRLYRLGVRKFFRLDQGEVRLRAMGDCGAFSYVDHDEPPYSVDEVIDFYERGGFDLGISVDHVILGYRAESDEDGECDDSWAQRQALTLDLAEKFIDRCQERGCSFEPVGVAQGWSPTSYARAFERLQEFGYARIALGGMVPLKTEQILDVLEAVSAINKGTPLHLLGVTRIENVKDFGAYGVESFDSTSPFRQAFKDDRDNYYTPARAYTALRVPQVEGNAKLQADIRAGRLDQDEARRLEQRALRRLFAHDEGKGSLSAASSGLLDYERFVEQLRDRSDAYWEARSDAYGETLDARPWQDCPCGVCRDVGVQVILFRGTERNKRRGFHNVFVFNQTLQGNLAEPTASRGAAS